MTTASNNPGITNDPSLGARTATSLNQEMMIVNTVRQKKAAIKEQKHKELLQVDEEGAAQFRNLVAPHIDALLAAADRTGLSRYKAYAALAPAFSFKAKVRGETPLSPVNVAAPHSHAQQVSPVANGEGGA